MTYIVQSHLDPYELSTQRPSLRAHVSCAPKSRIDSNRASLLSLSSALTSSARPLPCDFSSLLASAPRAPRPTTMAGGSHARGKSGAPTNHRKRKAPSPAAAAAAAEDEDEAESEAQKLRREVEELEKELADLDRRVLDHVRSNAARLVDAAVTRPAALRPPAPPGTALFLPCARARVWGWSALLCGGDVICVPYTIGSISGGVC